ncbi:hypothetical protein OPIT5_01750 [Opitutaceae bacterium TAV5]|nr:hypothetical protein OPIT5_01750 [Opitutaceae bacterium TAV5]
MRFPVRLLPAALGLLLPALSAAADNDHDHDATVALLFAFDADYGVYGLDEGAEDDPATYALTRSLESALTSALHVGYYNPWNLLTVTGDSTGINTAGLVIGENSDSNGVFLGRLAAWTVTASDTSALIVGNYGGGNVLSVTGGAKLVTGTAVNITIGAWSEGNRVEISGKDAAGTTASSWEYAGAITVGYFGGGNTLEIRDGATVTAQVTSADTATYIGYASDGNAVTVSGAGTVWNATASGSTPGGLYVGYGGSDNILTISDGAVVESRLGGGTYTTDKRNIIGFEQDATGNKVIVDGEGSRWDTLNVTVGYEGSGNSLEITNGGMVNNNFTFLYLGAWAGSENNTIKVSGEGSELITSHLQIGGGGETPSLRIPGGGSDNRLEILDGGAVRVTTNNATIHIGSGAESRGNSVLVSGPGSTLTMASTGTDAITTLLVGAYGDDNLLEIKNGGVVNSLGGTIGYWQYWDGGGAYAAGMSTDNRALVTGKDSAWNMTGALNVGYGGQDNRLDIEDGGVVTSGTGVIGSEQARDVMGAPAIYRGADGNTARISGRDAAGNASAWEVAGALTVGRGGSDNTLAVEAGGRVTSGASVVGVMSTVTEYNPASAIRDGTNYGADDNAVLISGRDAAGNASAWEVDGKLTVGQGGQRNTLTISDGGRVTSGSGLIGQYGNIKWEARNVDSATISYEQTGADDNAVTVTGAGSRWEITGDLTIGFDHNGSFASAYNVNGLIYTNMVAQVFLGNATGNTLTIGEGGLVAVTGDFSITAGNFLQMAYGYFAWEGDNVAALNAMIAAGSIKFGCCSGETNTFYTADSEVGSSFTYSVLYYESQEAVTAAFGDALGGVNLLNYTILAMTSAVPEPATCAALVGLVLLAFAAYRRFGAKRQK